MTLDRAAAQREPLTRLLLPALIVALCMIGTSPALAQVRVATLEELRRELSRGDFISLVQRTGDSVRGRLVRFADTALDIRTETRQVTGKQHVDVTVPLGTIRSLERPRDSSRNGVLIGAGVGAGVSLGMFIYAAAVDYNEIDEWGQLYLAMGAVYTGVGALVGWAIDSARSNHKRPGEGTPDGCTCQSHRAETNGRGLAGPAGNVEQQRVPGEWNSQYRTGPDPAGFVIQCQDPKSSMGSLLIDPLHGMIPYQPWAEKKRMEYLAATYAPQKRMDLDTDILCLARGIPHATTAGNFRIRYMPGYVVIFSIDLASRTRIIPMDGSPHLSDSVMLFMGDSRGHWEGNTLVVETTNNRDGTWFDKHGTFHSEGMKVTERWTMVTQDQMYYEAAIEDPAVFTRSWRLAMTFDRAQRELQPSEDSCHSGEHSADRVVRAGIRARKAGISGYHIHVDLRTGKAIRPEEQHYLDESGQPLGHSYAPAVPDEAIQDNK